MESRSASSERGADERTGRDGTPSCHQGCSVALSFVEGTVAVLTWCSLVHCPVVLLGLVAVVPELLRAETGGQKGSFVVCRGGGQEGLF